VNFFLKRFFYYYIITNENLLVLFTKKQHHTIYVFLAYDTYDCISAIANSTTNAKRKRASHSGTTQRGMVLLSLCTV